MAQVGDRRGTLPAIYRQVHWRGRSGRFYALTPERFDSFALAGGGVYLLARGTMPMWVGASDDVVHDQASRARFRLALAAADRVFAVDASVDEAGRLALVWDLEGAEPVSGLSAA